MFRSIKIPSYIQKIVRTTKTLPDIAYNLKEDDKKIFRDEYYAQNKVKKKNLGAYIKQRQQELAETYGRVHGIERLTPAKMYKKMAETKLLQMERDTVLAAQRMAAEENLRRNNHRIYPRGVENQLENEGLTIAQIEQHPSLAMRMISYSERTRRAPVIQREILEEADRQSAAMLARLRARGDYEQRSTSSLSSEGEGLSRKIKRKTKRKKYNRKNTRKKKSRQNIRLK